MTNKTQQNHKILDWLSQYSLLVFIVFLCLLVALLFAAQALRQEHPEEAPAPDKTTAVQTYTAGQTYLTTQAKVADEGVINVLSQSAGVVQRVNIHEGDHLYRGRQLARLSETYSGASVSSLQLELAEKNWLVTHANYWDQEKVDDINHELNQNTAWTTRWETNGGSGTHGNGDAYTSFSGQQKSELLELSETMTNRGQRLSLDQAESNYFQAQIAASLLSPVTPVAGTVEKVNVTVGQMVSAGTSLAVIKADKAAVKLKVSLGENVVRKIDVTAPAQVYIGGSWQEVMLDYLPTVPTTGNSYDLSFTLPAALAGQVANGTFVKLRLPLEAATAQEILVPLNAVYQTQTAAYAYIVDYDDHGQLIARQMPLTLGAVVGNMVTVIDGLQKFDQIILDSGLMDGQAITVTAGTSLSGNNAWEASDAATVVKTSLE